MDVAIIGGGLTGLAAGYELSRAGHRVLLFEKEAELGGQASAFSVGGTRLERFYHHIFLSDRDIIGLINEVGLEADLEWRESKVGFLCQGKIYDFATASDLLRFTPLGLFHRLRLGLVSLYLQRQRKWQPYETVTARDWILKHAGQRVYEVVWGPLLRGKFGESHAEVSMAWFWSKMRYRFGSRRGLLGRERLGYLRGSFARLAEALAERIQARGGEIHTSSLVTGIAVEGGQVRGLQIGQTSFSADAIIATIPSFAFLRLVPQLTGEYREKLARTRYLTALCLVLVLNRSLSRIYWMNISDPLPFVGAIEHTNFIEPGRYQEKHILYLTNYLSPGHPLRESSLDEVKAAFLPSLRAINSDFREDWVEGVYLFREEGAQPIIPLGYSRLLPEHGTPIRGLYLANTSQIYPEDRGMNYSVHLGQKVARLAAGQD